MNGILMSMTRVIIGFDMTCRLCLFSIIQTDLPFMVNFAWADCDREFSKTIVTSLNENEVHMR